MFRNSMRLMKCPSGNKEARNQETDKEEGMRAADVKGSVSGDFLGPIIVRRSRNQSRNVSLRKP
jgi:hypothetical protein